MECRAGCEFVVGVWFIVIYSMNACIARKYIQNDNDIHQRDTFLPFSTISWEDTTFFSDNASRRDCRKTWVVYLQGRGFWGYEAGRHVKHRDSGRDVADYLVVVLARVVRGEGVEAVCLESVWVVAAASVLDDWLAFTRNLKLTPYHSDALPLVAL